MARKAVLTGGKRDEIIHTAMQLFFEHGYEATSVRMIMNEVGGEIGMFYHYFKSKDMLFDTVVERFFLEYRVKFEEALEACETREDFVKTIMPLYEQSMESFNMLKGNIHWTIQSSMHVGTLMALKPAIESLLEKWQANDNRPVGILAGQLLYGLSATVHSTEFETMNPPEKEKCVLDFIGRILDRP